MYRWKSPNPLRFFALLPAWSGQVAFIVSLALEDAEVVHDEAFLGRKSGIGGDRLGVPGTHLVANRPGPGQASVQVPRGEDIQEQDDVETASPHHAGGPGI